MTGREETRTSSSAEGAWSVWRQDDHGNRFKVCQGLSQTDALCLVAEFEARGHKQSYWAESSAATTPPEAQ
jgi:hypothetical protein